MNPPEDANAEFSELIARLGHDEDYFSFAAELVDGVIEKIEVLDSIIRELVDNWEFSRIAKADLALLRVSLYELKYRLDIPPVVIIDETLEISKEFSSENSRKFLNGVLDKARSMMPRPARKPAI